MLNPPDVMRMIEIALAAVNVQGDELASTRVYALPNERLFEVVTNRNRFRYDPINRTLVNMNMPVTNNADRITIREGVNNTPIRHFEYTNRWEEVTVANLTPAGQVIMEANQAAQVAPANPPDVISVIVRRDNYGSWDIRVSSTERGGMAIPEVGVIKSFLPPEWKRLLGGRHSRRRRVAYYLTEALNAGLPTQVLHDALQAWAFTYVKATTEAVSTVPVPSPDDSFLLNAQPATIFVGGKSFKLVPTGERDNTNIYRHIRDKAKAIAQIEVQAKLDRAQTDARILVSEASERANRLRQEMDELRRNIATQAPEWARNSGRPLKLRNGRWYIGLRVSTYLEDIRYRVASWNATLHWNPIRVANHDEGYYNSRPMLMWFMLSENGQYDMYHVISDDIWYTVHTSDRACMELQGLPPRITNLNDLTALERGVSRGIRGLNHNSPLSHELDKFYPLYVEQLPKVTQGIIRGDIALPPSNCDLTPQQYLERANANRPVSTHISWDRIETDNQEMNYTFTVPVGTGGTNVQR